MANGYPESPESGMQQQPETAGAWDDDSLSPGECIVLPKICVSKRYLDELTEDCLDAIMSQNDPPSVFQRNGSLARLKNVTESKIEIELINKDMLVGKLARSAYFVNDKDVPVSPPKGAASDILSLPGWDLPILSGVVSSERSGRWSDGIC